MVNQTSTDIDAERLPRKGLLKDPLAEVTGKEKRVQPVGGERREKPQLGYGATAEKEWTRLQQKVDPPGSCMI